MVDRRFSRAVDAWLDSISSPNTRAAYRRDIEVYAAWIAAAQLRATEATAADLDEFRDHCVAEGSGPATVNRRLAAVSSFYRQAPSTWGGANPAASTERSVLPAQPAPVLSAAAAQRVWNAAEERGGTSAVIVGLVLFDGFKTKDLLPLDVDDVRWSRGVATIDGVALHVFTAAAIRALVGARRAGPLLTRESADDRLTRFGVDFLVKRVGVDAGLASPLTINALRAVHASRERKVAQPDR